MHRDCQSPSCKFDWFWRNVRLEKRRKSACIHVWYVIVQKSDTRIDDTVAASHWSVTSLETVGLPLPSTKLMPLLALQRVEALALCHRWDVPALKTFEELIFYNYVFVMIHDTGCIWYILHHVYCIHLYYLYLPAQITTATYLSWLYTSEGCFRFFSPYGANVSPRPLKRTWRTGQSWGRHGLADGNTGWCHRCCLVVTFWPCIFETFWDIRWI